MDIYKKLPNELRQVIVQMLKDEVDIKKKLFQKSQSDYNALIDVVWIFEPNCYTQYYSVPDIMYTHDEHNEHDFRNDELNDYLTF